MRIIPTVTSPAAGNKEVSRLTSTSGVARRTSTVVTVDDAAVLEEWENLGVAQHRLRGDGRIWARVLTDSPTSPVQGDIWLEDADSLGIVLRYHDGVSVKTVLADESGKLAITATDALLQGHAVVATPDGIAYAETVVDGDGLYRVAGVLNADVALDDAGEVLTTGDVLELEDWSLLTGAATLEINSRYWLSSTPGRYTTTPDTDVASSIGLAMTETKLLIDTGTVVIM